RRGSGIVASSARNGSKDFKDFKATSHRFGRLTQIQTFSPRGIVRYACRIKNLKTVAYGTQLRALNSPAPVNPRLVPSCAGRRAILEAEGGSISKPQAG